MHINIGLFGISLYTFRIMGYSIMDHLCSIYWDCSYWCLYNIKLIYFLGVLGHECGHGAFSENQILNDVLGFILHELLLVPYFSW